MPKNRGSSPGEEGGGEGGDTLTGKLSGGCEAHSLKPLPNFRRFSLTKNSGLTKNLIPYFRSSFSCFQGWRNNLRGLLLIGLSPNDEEVAFSKRHTQFRSIQDCTNHTLFQTKTDKKPYPHMGPYEGEPPPPPPSSWLECKW